MCDQSRPLGNQLKCHHFRLLTRPVGRFVARRPCCFHNRGAENSQSKHNWCVMGSEKASLRGAHRRLQQPNPRETSENPRCSRVKGTSGLATHSCLMSTEEPGMVLRVEDQGEQSACWCHPQPLQFLVDLFHNVNVPTGSLKCCNFTFSSSTLNFLYFA